jgi:hypothetical protein
MALHMPNVKCKICNKDFHTKPSQLKRGYGKFCSTICQYDGQKTGKFIACEVCGKEAWKTQKDLKKSKSGKFFCSKTCQTIWRNKKYVGDKHVNWRGGEFTYHRIMKENNINPICASCGVKDRRVLLIHHKDHNRKNNNINNLVWLCWNCHFLVHNFDKKI